MAAEWLHRVWADELGAFALDLLRFEARRLGTSVTVGPVRVRWGDSSRAFRHRRPWSALRELASGRPVGAAAQLEWLLWHSGLFGISVLGCDTDAPSHHLAVEVGAAYAVDTSQDAIADLRDRATRCAHLAFDDHHADMARSYGESHFTVPPSLPLSDYLHAARDLPGLVTLIRDGVDDR